MPSRSRLPFDDSLASQERSTPPGPETGAIGSSVAPSVAVEPLPDTYEQALAELERLVVAMEAGKLPLEQLLVSYRRGADLLEFCRARLESVEQQVKVLDEGRLKPWAGA